MAKKVVAFNEDVLASVKTLNELAIANSEKLLEMNVAALRKQADVTLAAWRSALDLKDLQDVQGYVAAQSEVAKDVVEGMVADAKVVAKIGEETAAEMTKLVNANFAAVKKVA